MADEQRDAVLGHPIHLEATDRVRVLLDLLRAAKSRDDLDQLQRRLFAFIYVVEGQRANCSRVLKRLPHGGTIPKDAKPLRGSGSDILASPVLRRKSQNALGCPKIPVSMRRRDPRLVVCDGNHADDEACCIKTATLNAEEVPSIFQFPFWGTPEWEAKYAKRTNVERGYSTIKNPDVIGLNKGLFHMRGLPNFSLLVTCMWIAHNLYLRMKAQADLAKAVLVGRGQGGSIGGAIKCRL